MARSSFEGRAIRVKPQTHNKGVLDPLLLTTKYTAN